MLTTLKIAPRLAGAAALALLALAPGATRADSAATSHNFDHMVRPLLKQYCLGCHSTEKHKGDFDMEQFSSFVEVRAHAKAWIGVQEQLANGEMPPKDKPQPTAAEKKVIADWVRGALDDIAAERAGDPGPVVLRRLSNAEYTYTIQDLTGVESLQPAREFPVDGAAGEGFMNTGQALVMSPSLVTKYLDAGKEIASHAMLLPDGIRFSPKATRRDWTAEILAEIRGFYREFTDPQGGEKVNLQGIVFETNEGGRLPVEKYMAVALKEREALRKGSKTARQAAQEHGLNPKYFGILWDNLSAQSPSLLLEGLRSRWLAAKPEEAAAIAAEINQVQKALWKFGSVGHIGKVGGPKAWMEPVNSLTSKQEVRLKLPASSDGKDLTLYLSTLDAGDGSENDYVVWEKARLTAPGQRDILLRDVRDLSRQLVEARARIFAAAAKCLTAAAEAGASQKEVDPAELAKRHNLDVETLAPWLDYLGIGSGAALRIDSYFTNKMTSAGGYDFIKGWGSSETPSLIANSSDQQVRIPGTMKPHGVTLHPSPKLQAVAGWRAPVATVARIEAAITHAHPECGNGVTWSLELRRGVSRQRLAAGTAQGSKEVKIGPFENLAIQRGDLVSVLIGPRDGNHSCDLTAVDLAITPASDKERAWNLAADVSADILAGNPHADRFGNEGVWHFYTEPDKGGEAGPVIPAGSLLAKWQSAAGAEEKQKLGEELQKLLVSGPPGTNDAPNSKLYAQLASLGGPLFNGVRNRAKMATAATGSSASTNSVWGLDPSGFGRHPSGREIDPADLCLKAPAVVEIRVPADLAAGGELVASVSLDKQSGAEGSAQVQALLTKPEPGAAWRADLPVVVNDGSAARKKMEAAYEDFRRCFPAALCYSKIVPVDEVITLTLFHREDDHLSRLMLNDAQKARLDALWDRLRYVSQDALTMVDAFEQLMQYASQDSDPKIFEPLRKPIMERAAALRQRLKDTEPKHIEAALDFARRAYRRPLTEREKTELRDLYHKLRKQELPHDEAIRLVMARTLVAPAFLYRAENPAPGTAQTPVSDWELANRLSYFLWSSMPDDKLTADAAAGALRSPETLAAQTRRMLGDARVRRLATEFACQWLNIRDLETLDEKSDRHFPTFKAVRGAMQEESVRFFTDMFQSNGSVLGILNADHTFLNEALAKHYGIPGVTGDEWRRVEGMGKHSRGGILAQAAVLSKQSGASRTSPILRGNWVAEALLGDKLPKPPKDVPRLPNDEATESLTVRQLTEKHSTDPRCAGCHVRIDPYGFALEGFDAIGRHRERDLGNRPIDTRAKTLDGAEFDGLNGLRDYLATKRRDAFLRQFSRKLLGYALGRAVQLSDEPLLAEIATQLQAKNYGAQTAIATIVQSRQFREIRGRDMIAED